MGSVLAAGGEAMTLDEARALAVESLEHAEQRRQDRRKAEAMSELSNYRITVPEYKSTLLINGSSIAFNFADNKPCLWRRFWQLLLLGWKWEDYK